MPVYRFLNFFRSHALHLQILLLILLYLLLDHEYRNFVVPHFSHLNFSYSFSLIRLLGASGVFILALTSLMLFKPSPYMHATSVLLIVLMLIPNLILFQYMHSDPVIPISMLLFIMLLRVKLPEIRSFCRLPAMSQPWPLIILCLLAVVFMLPVVSHFGFRIHLGTDLLNPAAQYEIREGVNREIHALTSYSLGQLTKAILPAMLLAGIVWKKYWLSVTSLLLTVYLFAINPHKTTLFILAPLLFFVLFREHSRKTNLFLGLVLTTVLITMVTTRFYGIMPESLLVRRSFFTQAFLTHAYFDFFRGEPVYFAHSFLSGIFHYGYALDPAHLIGQVYFGSSVMSCNTGFIGDGFMNLGYAGVFIFLMMAAALFHLIDQLKLKPGYFGLTFLILFQMINTSLLTLVLTHGLLMLILLMSFILRDKQEAGQKPQTV